MHILLVEDDKKLNTIIRSFLQKQSYICESAYSIQQAEAKLDRASGYDVIILDVLLPDGSGIDFVKKLRATEKHTPVLMLTSKVSTIDKISGLDAGADDYMPKPFSPNELQARLRALVRRQPVVVSDTIECSNITIDTTGRVVKKDGQEIRLMPTEFNLLEQLMRSKNTVVKREDLLRSVWGLYSNTSANRLDVYIRYLREKIDDPFEPKLIQTVRGKGYKIAD